MDLIYCNYPFINILLKDSNHYPLQTTWETYVTYPSNLCFICKTLISMSFVPYRLVTTGVTTLWLLIFQSTHTMFSSLTFRPLVPSPLCRILPCGLPLSYLESYATFALKKDGIPSRLEELFILLLVCNNDHTWTLKSIL